MQRTRNVNAASLLENVLIYKILRLAETYYKKYNMVLVITVLIYNMIADHCGAILVKWSVDFSSKFTMTYTLGI